MRLRPPQTLFNVPYAYLSGADLPPGIGVLGVPFDMGTHAVRVGARKGPQHIRACSALAADRLRNDVTKQILLDLGVVDVGDVDVRPGEVGTAFPAISEAVDALQSAGLTPLTLGGDGAVTLPQVRSVSKKHKGLCIVHFDAHTDAYQLPPDQPYTNATTFTHTTAEGLVAADDTFHIGLRETTYRGDGGNVARAESMGQHVTSASDVARDGVTATITRVRDKVGQRPIYLCWDMDVFDPSVCPGVVTPSWGGLTAREGFMLLTELRGLNVVAVDINTISPPHDPTGVSGSLAAYVAAQCLRIFADSPGFREELNGDNS